MDESIKVVIIDRYHLFREGVKLILETNSSFEIIAESDKYEVLEQASSLFKLDVLLLDINIFMKNIKNVKQLIEEHDMKVIVLADKGEECFVTEAIKIGVHGFLFKEMDKNSFIQAIHSVKSGEMYIHPEATRSLIEEYQKLLNGDTEEEFKRPHHLYTKRECEILQLLTDGQSNRKISETLGISEKTVKNHVSSLFKKMQVNDRTQAVVKAIRNDWVQL